MQAITNILITGASSGIGRSLACQLAASGARLHLGGRNQERLADTASRCRSRGATVVTRCVDVRDAPAMATWITESLPLDLVIANAGISARFERDALEPAAQIRDIMATNVGGTLNTLLPALEAMRRQPIGPNGTRGRLAAVASLASFVPSPMAPAYCGSKAAIDNWLMATTPAARREGILITSVCPGFVRTPMVATNRFPMPGLMDAERAAAIALRAILRGRPRVAFPWYMYLGARVASLLPIRFAERTLMLRDGAGKARQAATWAADDPQAPFPAARE